MTSPNGQLEAAVLQTMMPQLEAEGFEVFLHPSSLMLPGFLKTYRPDAIALKNDKKLAIEIMSATGENAEAKLESLRKLFLDHQDWELRVLYAPPRVPEQNLSIASRSLIEDYLNRAASALDAIGPIAALLTIWSAFEAAARSLIPNELRKPQTPSRLIEVLASDGYVTPEEADLLRRLGHARNEAAHGRLDIIVAPNDLEKLIQTVRTLIDMTEPKPRSF